MFSWSLPKDHHVYITYDHSVKNVTLTNLMAYLQSLKLCSGVNDENLLKHFKKHSIPKLFNPTTSDDHNDSTDYYRSTKCLLLDNDSPCSVCSKEIKSRSSQEIKSNKRKSQMSQIPAKPNAPISSTSTERIKLTLQHYRLENKELTTHIKQLQDEISKSSMNVSNEMSKDLITVMSNADQSNVSPFMKFFWEEQQKYLSSSPTGVRYHPMIIRYCLSLASKSSAVYNDLRYDEKTGTGVLKLPTLRRLRDYKNYIKPERGFNQNIIEELRQKTKDFSDPEKYMVLLLDEMKIQENLVWDKHTGELIGFVDLGDIDVNYATLQKTDDIATHVLVFMLRSIVNSFKFSFANFATTGATACQMFPLLWKAISICELNSLKVIAVTCDGASPNRKLFRMHFSLNDRDDMNDDVTYKTPNLFATDGRYVYFISDPSHLIKTSRNCFANSGSGRCTRFMWNDEMFIIWNHVADLFHEDRKFGLHMMPTKITYEHIKLTPYSVMNVKLAAQILSSSVSNSLLKYGPPEAAGTAKFCSMMDSFFDIVNIRSTDAHDYELKPFLAPFSSINDPRFSWLRNVFLQYFTDWLISIEERHGNFTKNAKNNMFISHQTYEGLKITVNSIIESVKFLLQNDVKFVLTERFCQDPLENYFGHQRSLGRKTNPSVFDIGYNDNAIRNQKIFKPIAGNVAGADQAMIDFTNEPLPCRKKPKKNHNN